MSANEHPHEPSPAADLADLAERSEVLAAWASSMRRRALSEVTIYARVNMVRRWWIHVDGRVWRATHHDVERFIDSPGPLVAGSRRTMIGTLHVFYLWARRERRCRLDPTDLVDRPKVPPGLPRPFPEVDLALALALAQPHERAAMLLAAGCGLRAIEIARLRWDDVSATTVRVLGKGTRSRVVPLHPDARDALLALDRLDHLVFPWRDRHGNVTSGRRVSKAVNEFLHDIGISSTLHQLRHWFATATYASSHDIHLVQQLLGHANPNTTQIYAKLDTSRMAPIVNALQIPGMPARSSPAHRSVVTRQHRRRTANVPRTPTTTTHHQEHQR